MRSVMKIIGLFLILVLSTISTYARKAEYENLTRLYIATFSRAPDYDGIEYWIRDAMPLERIAESFFEQPETKRLYEDTKSTEEFIERVYENTLSREADSEGLKYWKRELESGNVSKATFILAVADGAMAQGEENRDYRVLRNRTEVAMAFWRSGLNDIEEARKVVSSTDESDESLEAALLEIEKLRRKVLPGYPIPSHKEGLADRNNNALSESRYEIFEKSIGFSLQKYNYYWRDAENAVKSSAEPMECPEGYFLFPANAKQKSELKFHRYHCYKKDFVNRWEKRFVQNSSHSMNIAVVLWTAPTIYIDKGCEGFYFELQKRYLKGGCYPKEKHYDDYEDWIRHTAYKFGGYIDHYIVWNEADSTDWADASTSDYSKEEMVTDMQEGMRRSFEIYSELLKRTVRAVEDGDKVCSAVQGECRNFVYISTSWNWYSTKSFYYRSADGGLHIIWQNRNLLDYLWKSVGLDYDWAIATHPYGDVYSRSDTSLRFSTLTDLSDYQKREIEKRSDGKNWLSYPQSRIFASEQNAGTGLKADDWKRKAKFICESYAVGLNMPALLAMTHNHFQDTINPLSQTPGKHTMLPPDLPENLEGAENYPTFEAYLSTSEALWEKSDDHYCCRELKLGCAVK